ncbi:MAG: DUF1573 domain-containing protein [Phycisphaerales bacterium]
MKYNLEWSRRALMVIGVGLLAASLGSSATQAGPVRSQANHGSDDKWTRVVGSAAGSLGKCTVGETAAHACHIKNVGASRATLRKVQSSCSCLTIQIEPAEIGPDEEARIAIIAPVVAAAGRQEHYVIIEAAFVEDGKTIHKERVHVSVGYEADLALLVDPRQLHVAAVEGRETLRTIYIRSRALDAVNVRDLECDLKGVHVGNPRRFVVPSPDRPGEEALAIPVAFRPTQTGLFCGELVFRTDDQNQAEVRIPIELNVRSQMVAAPAGFALIMSDGQGQRTDTVVVRRRDGQPFEVAGARVAAQAGGVVDGFKILLDSTSDRVSVRVQLETITRVLPQEGVGSVELLDRSGVVIDRLPLAWVKVTR